MLDKEDIVTAKAIARKLKDSPSDNLVVVGLLLEKLIEENQRLKAKALSVYEFVVSQEEFRSDKYA